MSRYSDRGYAFYICRGEKVVNQPQLWGFNAPNENSLPVMLKYLIVIVVWFSVLFLDLARRVKKVYRQRRYTRYMRSDAWQKKRKVRKKMAGGICERCGVARGTDCHHVTYVRFGKENVKTDLRWLCRMCHRQLHGRIF